MNRAIIAVIRFFKNEAYIFNRDLFYQRVFNDVFVIIPARKFVPNGVKKNKKGQNKNGHSHPAKLVRPE